MAMSGLRSDHGVRERQPPVRSLGRATRRRRGQAPSLQGHARAWRAGLDRGQGRRRIVRPCPAASWARREIGRSIRAQRDHLEGGSAEIRQVRMAPIQRWSWRGHQRQGARAVLKEDTPPARHTVMSDAAVGGGVEADGDVNGWSDNAGRDRLRRLAGRLQWMGH